MTRGLGGESPANVNFYLKGMDFPAGREDLVRQAQQNDAPPEVLDVIKRMPDRRFQNMANVMEAYGEAESNETAA